MKHNTAAIKAYSKKLVELSLDNHKVSSERVAAVLKIMSSKPPRHLKPILKLYLRYLKREVKNSHAYVEYAGDVSKQAIDSMQKMLEHEVKRPIDITTLHNKSLLAGVRVSLGDNVWETSAASRLQQLASRF